MRGRDGNIHRGWPETGQIGMSSHLGSLIPVVVGKLMAKRMKGEENFVGLTTIGEGGMQTGATHEGMNIAAVEKVPSEPDYGAISFSEAQPEQLACMYASQTEPVLTWPAELRTSHPILFFPYPLVSPFDGPLVLPVAGEVNVRPV